MIVEEQDYVPGDGDAAVFIPETTAGRRWLEVRRRIEQRQELKRLRELLDDPDLETFD